MSDDIFPSRKITRFLDRKQDGAAASKRITEHEAYSRGVFETLTLFEKFLALEGNASVTKEQFAGMLKYKCEIVVTEWEKKTGGVLLAEREATEPAK